MSRGKLTLDPDCSAVESSFTLLSRDSRKSESYTHPELSLIIPRINVSLQQEEEEILKQFDNFTTKNKELLLTHITHHINDLNVASIRISKLRDFMREFEPVTFKDDVTDHYHHFGLWGLTVTLLILYVCVKFGILICNKIRLTTKKSNKIYAIKEGQEAKAPEAIELVDGSNPQQSPRRSTRLIKIRT